MYGKFSNTEGLSNEKITNYSLNLSNSESINDIKIIDENNILIIVSNNEQLYLIIYNLDKKKIISKIGR